jgi:hypothetical protein
MQKDLAHNLNLLFQSIQSLKKDYDALYLAHQNLKQDFESLTEKHRDLQHEKLKLMEEHKNTKLGAALAGNPEHNRLMKNHINRLIKEIDLCMAQIVNNSL